MVGQLVTNSAICDRGNMCIYESIYEITWFSNTLSGISEIGYGLNYAFLKNVLVCSQTF
jgi:hypothetical protein